MKTLKSILIICCIVMPLGTFAQAKLGSPKLILNALNKDKSISNSFKKGVVQVSKNLKSCNPWIIIESVDCDKIIDPWNKNSTSKNAKQRQISAVKNLEKAISQGQGGHVLPKKIVSTAQKKHPGYTQQAMSSRFKMYVKQMERVFEDE